MGRFRSSRLRWKPAAYHSLAASARRAACSCQAGSGWACAVRRCRCTSSGAASMKNVPRNGRRRRPSAVRDHSPLRANGSPTTFTASPVLIDQPTTFPCMVLPAMTRSLSTNLSQPAPSGYGSVCRMRRVATSQTWITCPCVAPLDQRSRSAATSVPSDERTTYWILSAKPSKTAIGFAASTSQTITSASICAAVVPPRLEETSRLPSALKSKAEIE